MDQPTPDLPTIEDIRDAAERIALFAVRTPLIECPALTSLVGARVLLKVETLQRVGAFKFRGAYNRVSRIDRNRFPGGVVAASSGNHGQGVAEAARLLDFKSAIVMPKDAPRIKIANTRAAGAEVVLYDRERENRDSIANALARERRADFVHPFDDRFVIAGQGTVGLELMEDAQRIGAEIDHVLVPVSGAGLVSGIAIAVKAMSPRTEIHPVEPQGFDDLKRTLESGTRQRNYASSGSICDALLAPEIGRLNFALARSLLSRGFVVTDADVKKAMRRAFETLKLVVEPGGVIGLAALLSKAFPVEGKTIAVVLSGGNVDPEFFAEVLLEG